MEHVRVRFGDAELVLRDVEERDIDPIVGYWHDSDPAYLDGLGIDRSKLISREASRERFLTFLDDSEQRARAAFVVTLAGCLVAYTSINFWSPREGAVHVHVLDETLRHRGVSSLLFVRALELYFRKFQLTRLVLQTSPSNDAINGLLRKFGLEPRRTFLDQPDGLGRPGEFYVYELRPEMLSALGG
jgi:RimJ/RimL family protein N-acetyltransferase